MEGDWIQGAIKKPGALTKSLHIKNKDKIPEKVLKKAEQSENSITAKHTRLAETLKMLRKVK